MEAEILKIDRYSGKLREVHEIQEEIIKSFIMNFAKHAPASDMQFSPQVLARATLLNFKKNGKILNLPLFALSRLPDLVTQDIECQFICHSALEDLFTQKNRRSKQFPWNIPSA